MLKTLKIKVKLTGSVIVNDGREQTFTRTLDVSACVDQDGQGQNLLDAIAAGAKVNMSQVLEEAVNNATRNGGGEAKAS